MRRTDPWWSPDLIGEQRAEAVTRELDRIANDTITERDRYQAALALSADEPWADLEPDARRGQAGAHWSINAPLALNVVRPICSALRAELVQSRPRPMFLTSGGTYSERKRAELANKFIDGLFYEARVHTQIAPRCAWDMIVFGMGIAKVLEVDGRVSVERIMPWEVFVDAVDGQYGAPRSMYQIQWMDRRLAMATWPDKADEIQRAPVGENPWKTTLIDGVDVVLVTEAWHLPTGRDGDDGRHVIAIANILLHDEPWTRQTFPFAVMRWDPRPIGWLGKGVPEQLEGIQRTLRKVCAQIDLSHDSAAFQWVIDRGSRVNKAKVTNQIGAIIEYDGRPPQPLTPQPVSGAMYQWVSYLWAKAYEVIGVSQLGAAGQIPKGMEGASGVALDTYIDKNSARFVDVQQAYEEWHVDIARRACELLEELAADDRDYEVVHVSGKTVERVSWRDLRLSEPYVLQVWPTSLFPSTPAGKLKRLQELMESGIAQALGMDATTIQRLMNVPDLEAENLSSPRDAIDKLIERMITDEDETVTPDPVLPLDVCLSVAQRRYAYGLAEGMEEPKLELLRRWMAACTSLMDAASGPPEPAAPAAPPENPEAPPPDAGGLPPDAVPPGAGGMVQ